MIPFFTLSGRRGTSEEEEEEEEQGDETCSLPPSGKQTDAAPSEGQFLGRDELLQLHPAAAHQAEGRVHGSGAVHLPLVKAPHGVGVVEVHAARVVIQAHAQPLRHGEHAVAGRRRGGRRRGGLGDEELAHAHGEQGEGLRELVARVLAAAVMAAVVVIPGRVGGWGRGGENTLGSDLQEVQVVALRGGQAASQVTSLLTDDDYYDNN